MWQGRKAALLSVSDKNKLDFIGRELAELGFDLVATRSTAEALRKAGLRCQDVEELTGFPPILDGRVKTLHPAVFGGILARPALEQDRADLASVGSRFFEVVVCNLYPFESTLRQTSDRSALVEKIDVGGVSLLRAAAKNFASVSVLCRPEDYERFVEAEKANDANARADFRLELAQTAFAQTAAYDAMISSWFASLRQDAFPETKVIALRREQELRYGENPHQRAAVYSALGGSDNCLARANSKQGKALSYNNLLDAEHAIRLVSEFKECTVAILKHNTPCGVGRGKSVEEAFQRAFESDTKSPFGGIVCTNAKVTGKLASRMSEIFLVVVIAPTFDDEAREVLKAKKNLRVLELDPTKTAPLGQLFSPISGGALLQDFDSKLIAEKGLDFVTKKKPSESELEALLFGYTVVKHVRSNAIVFANGVQTISVAGGFTNRVDAVAACLRRATLPLEGAVLASDAFFPFADSVEMLAGSGVRAIIQPGGSVQDKAVIETCDKMGLSMVFTGMRHFKH